MTFQVPILGFRVLDLPYMGFTLPEMFIPILWHWRSLGLFSSEATWRVQRGGKC